MFDDWLDLMLYALQRRDDPYLDVLDRYDTGQDRDQGERPADYFAAAFGELQQGMAETDADLLGVIYEAFGQSTDAFGQYFTPEHVTDMIAEVSLGDVDPGRYDGDDPLTVADPACGSGRMLVHAAKRVPDDVDAAVFYGQDKDAMCAKMTALNLCLFNLDGYAVLGDSLKVEARRMWETRSTAMGGAVREVDPDEVGNPFEAALDAADAADAAEGDASADADDAVDVDVDMRQASMERWSE